MDYGISAALSLLGGAGLSGALSYWGHRKAADRWRRKTESAMQGARDSSRHLTFSTLRAMAYAIEAQDPYNVGHIDCVQRIVARLIRALHLEEPEATALRAAALAHNVGRLGIPEQILHKAAPLTVEEQNKLRTYSALSAHILSSIPLPWPVVPLVRHHTERWDGSGYPDGLRGEQIPYGARILAVANAYSALLHTRAFRDAYSPLAALAEIEANAGSQFDPGVVAAFRTVAVDLRREAEEAANADAPELPDPYSDIAAAQHETLGLYTLARAMTGSLHLEAVGSALLDGIRDLVPCAACALFIPEQDGDYLRACAALGINVRALLGSLARVGTYLTGRAFSRGEIVQASFLDNDLILRDVSDTWVPFRSTLIVPMEANGQIIGTLNLYAEEPDAFGADAHRVMRLIATQAAFAVESALRYAAVQETAYTDAMTGLRNARYLREYLEREVNRAQRDGMPLAVLNIDLDNFKPINDRFGHARGDQTLREVADILNSHVRNYDLAVRYAGDEFVVVLAQAGRVQAEVVSAKLKAAIERYGQRQIANEPGFPMVGISVGVALYPEDGQDLQALLCRSDAAMYTDKQLRKAGRPAA